MKSRIKLTKADHEVIEILKEVFQLKIISPGKSDDNLRLWIIRSFFLVSVFGLIFRMIYSINNKEELSEISSLFNLPIGLFFGALFLHINNKSENSSIIIFGLTWVSLMIGILL